MAIYLFLVQFKLKSAVLCRSLININHILQCGVVYHIKKMMLTHGDETDDPRTPA